ncbi:TPA: ABC transporter permease, partial [Streptococcus pyogenes]
KNSFLFIVWLVIISIIIIVSGIFLQETKASQSRINRQISQLYPWNKVRNWKRLELLGIENGPINNGEINEPESQYIQIATALKKLDFIYI